MPQNLTRNETEVVAFQGSYGGDGFSLNQLGVFSVNNSQAPPIIPQPQDLSNINCPNQGPNGTLIGEEFNDLMSA